MFNLNELAVIAYENAAKREAKDCKVSTDTRLMLKHTATEVVESAEAFAKYKEIKELASDLSAKDLDEKWESQEEPDVCEEYYQNTRKQFASELADIICCVLIIAGKERVDMELALTECMEKNYKRAMGVGDK